MNKKDIYLESINDIALEISIDKYWRKNLFELENEDFLEISFERPETIPQYVKDLVVDNKLSICVKKQNNCKEPFDEGLIAFEFWAKEYPEIRCYSGNNLSVI